MRLRHMEILYAVYTTGSVSGAAKLLHVSQPSVSKVLRHAEDQLGFQLFERTPNGLLPTPQADRLYSEVASIQSQLDSIRRVAANLLKAEEGSIRIAGTPALGLSLLPKAVAAFRKQNPGIHLDVQTRHFSGLKQSVLEGENEIGISFEPAKHPRIALSSLGEGELVGIFPKDIALPDDERISINALEGHPFISILDSGPLGTELMNYMEHHEAKLDTVASAKTYYLAKEMVREGVGVAIVDEFSARAGGETGMQWRYFDPPIKFGVKCMHLSDQPLAAPAKKFLSFLEKSFKDLTKNKAEK